ncbi:hypothetical protein BDR22DRAFT_510597 [Usnea florida]
MAVHGLSERETWIRSGSSHITTEPTIYLKDLVPKDLLPTDLLERETWIRSVSSHLTTELTIYLKENLPKDLLPDLLAKDLLARDLLAKDLLAKDLLPKGLLRKCLLAKDLLAKDLLPKGLLPKGLLPKDPLAKDLLPEGPLPKGLLRKCLLAKDLLAKDLLPKGLLPKGLLPKDLLAKDLLPRDLLPKDLLPEGRPLPEDFLPKDLKTLTAIPDIDLKGPFTSIDVKRPNEDITRLGHKVEKIRRGLPGFINGARTAALADTGAAQNVVSLDFAHRHGLVLGGKAAMFRLGNSKSVQSVGTVKVSWAFAEKPTKLYEILCHVIRHCTYDVILSSSFLAATETFSRHLHRLVRCVFNVFNVSHLNLMDGGRQTVDGQVGNWSVHAIADTGAERNVMDSIYAEALGFEISKGFDNRGFLQFADGTLQETIGQVDTTWTFASGLEIPITFEVLENCSANVILGEDFLLDHDVFRAHVASIKEIPYEDAEDEPADLSPFGYTNYWQQKFENGRSKIMSKFNRRTHRKEISEDETLPQYENEERHRRDHWTHKYGFEGANASPAEKEAEARRREAYNIRLEAFRRYPPCPGRDAPLSPSTSTAPETTRGRQSTAAPPVIPSIPTAPNATLVPAVPASATNTRNPPPTTSTSTASVPRGNAPSNTGTADQVRRGRRFR